MRQTSTFLLVFFLTSTGALAEEAPQSAPPSAEREEAPPNAPPPAKEETAAVQAPNPGQPLQLLVLDLERGGNITEDVARTIGGLVSEEIARVPNLKVVSGQDLQQLISLEQDKQVVGCDDTSECMAEIANALGARYVVFGRVSNLEELLVVQLNLLDAKEGRSVGRSSAQAQSLAGLPVQLRPPIFQLIEGVVPVPEEMKVAANEALEKAKAQSGAGEEGNWMKTASMGAGAAFLGTSALAIGWAEMEAANPGSTNKDLIIPTEAIGAVVGVIGVGLLGTGLFAFSDADGE